ncbi:hypothetical protein [Burkholderia sp. ISTR5]|uniref:hypothetical protein n=1 Tax=Burkholderia sp. ISTR5 TaxID=2500161 RepID=UPI001367D3BC|nr:hypothetical protein [Burkholderia sp. ISTR5]NBI50465.1 hypothetical protein [Burkholderia sp. ISTR5]
MQNYKHDPQQAHGAAEPFHVLVQRVTFARQQPLKPDVHDLGGLSRAFEAMLVRVRAGQPTSIRLAPPPESMVALVDAPRSRPHGSIWW